MHAFAIEPPEGVTVNSKWVYSKAALANASEEKILEIAAELEIAFEGSQLSVPMPPRNWVESKSLRVFISHVSNEKLKATRLRVCLEPYGISGFVAHEDIHPTLKWRGEIERALRTMDAFICMLTPGFSKSVWTQQEIGFAVCRGVKTISLQMGEVPPGFLGQEQALSRQKRSAEEVAKEVDLLFSQDPRTSERLAQAKLAGQSSIASDLLDDVPF